MLWSRTHYLQCLLDDLPGREMFVELFGPLVGLAEEWREQGASEEEIEMTAFDWDHVERLRLPLNHRPITGMKAEILEDTDQYQVTRDEMGRRLRLPKRRATIALPESFPISSPADWNLAREWYRFTPERVDLPELEYCQQRQQAGAVLRVTMPGVYATLRDLMGDENACVAFLEDPDLVNDILDTLGSLCERLFESSPASLVPDELFVHEDFAGKSGPLVGPDIVRDFFIPYYQRIWSKWSARGTRIFDIDTDGFIEPVIDALMEAGINCVHPLEPSAGMDMVRLRKRYGRSLILRGGIDKFALRRGKQAIDAELEHKMQPCMRGGGVMFGLDHRIPNGTPLEAYRYYVAQGRKRLGLPSLDGKHKGWARMA